jgi:hypothetical protein
MGVVVRRHGWIAALGVVIALGLPSVAAAETDVMYPRADFNVGQFGLPNGTSRIEAMWGFGPA